ncbi:MAG: LytTR family transcriptional regulator [Ignavibacteriaceae bacterium]|nr:LytTR family transcriptional regulator [Ignavibacteriaceae bacterium]NUM71519.1 LytTR family transcriptional regulator [Ignavibacteriaceae bacterium]
MNQPEIRSEDKRHKLIAVILLLLISINLLIDYFEAYSKDGSYYLSESLLFSSYWLLFLPFLNLQRVLISGSFGIKKIILITISSAFLHILLYPAVIQVISFFFYDVTYKYAGTLEFGIRAYLIKTVIIYGLSAVLFVLFTRKQGSAARDKEESAGNESVYPETLLADEPGNKKTAVPVSEIIYITSFTPYVNIFTESKKYLYPETLKSAESKLDKKRFIRIHKSHIISLDKVKSYRSRLNGDYDLTMSDGTVLRLSRNYAQEFKSSFEAANRLASK